MPQVVYGKRFVKSAGKLPEKLRAKLADLLSVLSREPYNQLLHTKPLVGSLTGLYSFRINREWRVIFQFNTPDEIQLLEVGQRKYIYK